MNKKELYQKLDNLENKISKLENRITKLDDLNTIFKVYKENEKEVFYWRQQGYFGSLQNCMNAVKSYVILNEINNHTLAEVKEILNKIDSIKVQIIDLTEEPKNKEEK